MKKLIFNFDDIEKKNISNQIYFSVNYKDIFEENNDRCIYPNFCENKNLSKISINFESEVDSKYIGKPLIDAKIPYQYTVKQFSPDPKKTKL